MKEYQIICLMNILEIGRRFHAGLEKMRNGYVRIAEGILRMTKETCTYTT